MPPPEGAAPAVKAKYAQPGKEELFRSLLVVPVKHVKARVAKYDVCLREQALWAVLAERTILERMVKFDCKVCRERFPTFHPAYEPPPSLELALLRRGRDGVAPCNIEVEEWDDVPALEM